MSLLYSIYRHIAYANVLYKCMYVPVQSLVGTCVDGYNLRPTHSLRTEKNNA